MARNGGDMAGAVDPDERVAQAYSIFAPPETYFIGRDGTIVARQIGQFSAASLDERWPRSWTRSDHGANLPATRPDARLTLAGGPRRAGAARSR